MRLSVPIYCNCRRALGVGGRPLATAAMLLCSVLALNGCSTVEEVADVLPDKKVEYKKARRGNPLEMPPGLAAPRHSGEYSIPGGRGATYSGYAQEERQVAEGAVAVLPAQKGIKVMRDGDRRWLVVNADADQLWDRTRDFWLQEGFLLQVADPAAGVMETDWSENRADIPSGFIRNTLKKVADFAYSAPTRDKYRTRFERGADPGVTEIYVTQQGVREVIADEAGSTVWQARPSDPELEAVMMARLAVFLGLEKERAKQLVADAERARTKGVELVRNVDGVSLLIKADYATAWREVGLALDRVGFAVEGRDRNEGVYDVRYHDPLKQQTKRKGWLDRINFWSSDDDAATQEPYRVKVASDGGGGSVVTVQDGDGARDNSTTAQRILTLVHEQLL